MRPFATVLACLIAVAPATAQGAKLAVGPDSGGYQCPDGRQLYVKSCYSESPAADCAIVQIHLPKNGKYQVETMDVRSNILASVASCKVYSLDFRGGDVFLKAPKQQVVQAAPPAAKPAPMQSAKPATPAAKSKTAKVPGITALVRISDPGGHDVVHYVDVASATPTATGLVLVQVVQVFPSGNPNFPGAAGVWAIYGISCKQNTIALQAEMSFDRKGNDVGSMRNGTKAVQILKGAPSERMGTVACKSDMPRGPRLPTVASAIADAATPLAAPGPTNALVRISPPGKAPIVNYVDVDSVGETGQKDLKRVWALMVFTEPNSAAPGAVAAWNRYEVDCKQQSGTRLTVMLEFDLQGKFHKGTNIDDVVRPAAKGTSAEKILIAACKTTALPGPRLKSLAAAIADAG